MADEIGAVIVNGQSTGASFNTPWIRIERVTEFSFQSKWTGTTTGTLTFEGSNSDNPNSLNDPIGPTTLARVPAAPAGDPAGSAGNSMLLFGPLNPCPFRWIRMLFTRSAGTGLMTVAICGKGASN